MSLRSMFGSWSGGGDPAEPKEARLLIVRVNGTEVGVVRPGDQPCELLPDIELEAAGVVEFEDAAGTCHQHHLPASTGWAHLSVRVHATLGCQADAIVTANPNQVSGAPLAEGDVGVRFQPFFLAGAVNPPISTGRGLFARGLHFSGTVTPGNILLSCECDQCRRTFLVRSFHAGFSEVGYFYSGSGRHTLTVDARVPGAPAALSEPDPAELAALEARLPPAPDGTRYAWLNPFRCPHCEAPYIDFAAHPGERQREYYGLHFPDTPPVRFAE